MRRKSIFILCVCFVWFPLLGLAEEEQIEAEESIEEKIDRLQQ